jgi:large subunit ribosomal protein L10
LRGKADVIVAKKNLISLAIDKAGKPGFEDLKKEIPANFALMFSDRDAFELSGILVDSLSPTRAKAGDIAPEDIKIEPGPTDLIPGPAISELGAVGLKVSVEAGKLAIKNSAVIVKGGEEINDKVAGVLGKLNITPMKVGFIPVAAYDSKDKKVYKNIKIDKKGTLEELREAIGRSLDLQYREDMLQIRQSASSLPKQELKLWL